jgi:transmembrane sensor
MNSSHDNISEELLARYLADTATQQERNDVDSWLAGSPLHASEFAAYRLLWDHSASMHKNRVSVNTDAAWDKMKMKMDKGPSQKPIDVEVRELEVDFSPKGKRLNFPVRIWVAAAFTLLMLSFGWFFLQQTRQKREPLQIATTNNTIEKILPDGTKVFLNYNSSLTYPENFDGDVRTVSLQGEAFFDVKPDAEHPFLIDANGTEIRVLGTSFNVKAYKEKPVRVDVSTGKVRVSKDARKIDLVKGEGAEVLDDTIRGIKANINMLGYRTQIYDFNAANLEDVITSIREGYHVDIRLTNQKIADCRLTIRFEKEPLDATLSVIAETLDLSLRKDGKVYWLDGNGCQ